MAQAQRCVHSPIVHAPDDGTIPYLLHPLQDFIDVAFPVHEMHQAWRRGAPCGPGRFPHRLAGLVDAVEPFAAFLRRGAREVTRRPRPGLEPRTPSTAPCSVKAKVLWSSTPWAKFPDPIGPSSGSTRHPVRCSEVVSWTTRTVL